MAQSVPLIRVGTRGSPLALAQAAELRAVLAAAQSLDIAAIEVCPIRTTGDMVGERPLAELGGKGLFTKEIDQALIDGAIDLAVHSAKDIPAIIPGELVIAAYLAREDPRDAFISRKAANLKALAAGAVVGTAAPRRHALVKRARPDVNVVTLRGNVETRLRKLDAGAADATLLALAGLKRLGLAAAATYVFETEEFLPAVGQGAIAIVARKQDQRMHERLAAISDEDTTTAVTAERAFLAKLEGSCRTPIAGHAKILAGELRFEGLILRPDGSESFQTHRHGAASDAAALGADAGDELARRAPTGFFS